MDKTKTLLIAIMLAALSAAMLISVIIKNQSVKSLYEDVTFTQITMEARQYVSNIEYGLKNGSELEKYYDMDSELEGICQSSSYIDGAYIVSAKKYLLYQTGVKAIQGVLRVPDKIKGSYAVYRDNGCYFVVTKINNADNSTAGFLIMRVENSAILNAVADYDRQNQIQSFVIGCEIAGIAVFIIRRAVLASKKKPVFYIIKTLSTLLILAVILDSGVTMIRYYQISNDASLQTVDKIAQALQTSLNEVRAKGVSSDEIYDLSGWLDKSKTEMPIVNTITAEKNEKITATVSNAYVLGFLGQSALRQLFLLAGCLLFCFTVYKVSYYRLKTDDN